MPTFVTRTAISPGTTGSWQDVDLSSLIASGATGVVVRVTNTTILTGVAVGWRKKGSTDNRINNLAADGHCQAFVGVDGSRVVQLYRGATDAVFELEAYFGSEAVFFTNAVAKTPGGGFSWSAQSIASDTGADTAIAAFLEFVGSWGGCRRTGSTDDRAGGITSHVGAISGCNGSESFDVQTDGSAVYVTGYLKSGATFATNGTDRSATTTGAYEDVAAFASGNNAALYQTSGSIANASFAIRPKGDTIDSYRISGGERTGWWLVQGDGSRVVQQKVSSASLDLYELAVFAESVVYSYARPTSDVTTQWEVSTGTSHFAVLDETVSDVGDYISAASAGLTDEVALGAMSTPKAGTSLAINYEVTGVAGGGSVTASLRQGSSTNIKTDTARTANGVYTLTVTSGEWASVTNWNDLRLRFVSA